MNRTLARGTFLTLFALFTLSVAASSQDAPKAPLPDWRTTKPSLDFLSRHLAGEDINKYEFSCIDLLTEFAKQAQVSVRFDARALGTVPRIAVTGAKDGGQRPLFELCQESLVGNSLTLVPEAGNPRRFAVDAFYNVAASAPVVQEADLAALSPGEWVALPYKLAGNNGSTVAALARNMVSKGGKIDLSGDGAVLLMVDQVSNLSRILEVVKKTDVARVMPKLVEYQRASSAHLGELAKALQIFLERYSNEMGFKRDGIYLTWVIDSRTFVGIVPQSLVPFIDSAVDAADKATQLEVEQRKLNGPDYVTFELALPEGVRASRIEGSIRVLLEPEVKTGDLRTLIKDEAGTAIIIRCRKWLEASVRDCFDKAVK